MAAATSPYNQLTSLSVPTEFAGKSLRDLQGSGEQLGRADLVAQILGISENTPLNADQTYDLYGTDLGSQEGAYLKSRFKQADAPEVRAQAPAIKSLESGKAPLKERYAALLKSINDTRDVEVQKSDINSAQELGRRGISTDSTFAGQYQQQQRNPVQVGFNRLAAETGLQETQGEQNINQMIANIQSQAGGSSIANQLGLNQQAIQQQQFNSQQSLQEKQLAQALEIAKMQNQPQSAGATPFQATSLGNQLYAFNPSTGQFTSGPSKAAASGGGGGDFDATLKAIYGI